MSTLPKTFLTISVTSFVLSFAPYFNDLGWGILRPVGAASFIVFFITNMLAREVALYDQEHELRVKEVRRESTASLLRPASAR